MAKKAARRKTAAAAPESEPAAKPDQKIRNRNLGVRNVPASQLKPHPKNWRKHGDRQVAAIRAVLEEVGFVGTLLAVERDDELLLIDGHLRSDVMEDMFVDVQVLDVSDKEIDLLLATHDAIGEMAEGDSAILDDLLAGLEISSGELADMFSEVMDELGIPADEIDPDRPRKDKKKNDCEYPLAPVFNERYDYAIIFARNETEWGAIQTLLELEREKNYKSTGVAVGRVVPATKFIDLWNKRDGDTDNLPKPQAS